MPFALKSVNIYRIAMMGQNFDDYPGFQQIPGIPIFLQQSVDDMILNGGFYCIHIRQSCFQKESSYRCYIIAIKYLIWKAICTLNSCHT